MQEPREPPARWDPPPAQHADLETGGGAKMPLMPNAPLLAACSDDQADGTAGAVALRLGASERGEVRAPVQAAVAAFVVGRGYLGGDGAVLVRADGHREDDDVTS